MSIYKNVMELLVEEEVARQFQALPLRVATYVNQVEWVAYALNQLPPLYATSEKGLHHQMQRGQAKHGAEIKQAVMRALAAIRRDPLRSSTPLESPYAQVKEVLLSLRALLRNDRLEWEAIPLAVEQAITHQSHPRRSSALSAHASANSPLTAAAKAAASKAAISKQPAAPPAPPRATTVSRPAAQEESFGWDDPLYNPR